ncbi:MAG: aminomethyl-transferring glycine dehydrogenase subunit GcvPB, partial [Candidatus Aenigmarchaeota archaeon]|nr:aminomethyl-transferring glycine dehydrogenase subunit GcvPB [Candidatus Aenigmarchaeota archaeon]
ADYIPVPVIGYDSEKYYFDYNLKHSIGKIKPYYGNFGIFVRAYTYILMTGRNGLRKISEDAILNANYLKEKLKNYYKLPFEQLCMHEFVLSGDIQKAQGVNTLGIAKRLMDSGIHPPTVYFPLIVHEAMMIEPTETESKETLDNFINVMKQIAEEIKENPQQVLESPVNTPVLRIDEIAAARKPVLKY